MIGFSEAGPWYFDASALVSLYVVNQFSEALNTALAERTDLVSSDLAITEVTSALCRLKREGRITSVQAEYAHRTLLADFQAGIFSRIELKADVHRGTETRLMNDESGARPAVVRAGDALHLGLALSAKCYGLVTFDHRLAQTSARAGLVIYPPHSATVN